MHKTACCCSVAKYCPTLCDPMNCSTPGFPVLHYLPEFAQYPLSLHNIHWVCTISIEFAHIHWVSVAIQPFHPLLPPSLPALNLSQHQGLFQWVLKYWSFSFSTSPSNEYSGFISLGLTGLISLQSKGLSRVFSSTSLKASILRRSAFFMVRLLHPYMTTGKTIAFTV